jgi:hypothetical protein
MLYRKIYKTIDLGAQTDKAKLDQVLSEAGHAITAAGGDPSYEMFYDEPSDRPYESTGIPVKDRDGSLREFSTISPVVEALNRQLWFRRLHVAPQWSELVRKIAYAVI